METKKASGCWVLAWVMAGAAVLMALFLTYGLMTVAKVGVRHKPSSKQLPPPADALKLDFDAALPDLMGADGSVSRDTLIRMERDTRITRLARDRFARAAQGKPVSWKLRVSDLSASADGAAGEFTLPFAAKLGKSATTVGSIDIRAEFDASQTEALAKLRRADWVEISGTLDLSSGLPVIRGAAVVP